MYNSMELHCDGTFSVKINMCNTGRETVDVRIEGSSCPEDDWWIVCSLYSKKLIREFHKIIDEI